MRPPRKNPITICNTPAMTMARSRFSNEPSVGNLGGNDGRETGSGTTHARVGAAEKSNHDAADHTADQPRRKRGIGGEGDAEAKGQRDEENDQAREIVAAGTRSRAEAVLETNPYYA